MLLGLVYLPDPETSQLCVEYAAEVTDSGGRRSTLGDGASPHVTVLHVETDVDPEIAWKESITEIAPQADLAFNGLVLQPYLKTYNGPDESPAVNAWILVALDTQLRRAFESALDLAWAKSGKPVVYNNVFSPHITLGICDGYPNGVALPPELLLRANVQGKLAIGPIGKHGVFEEVLFSA